MTDLLQRIQRWFTINCNGDWEHGYPISITTVDNPGWWVTIPLRDTSLQKALLPMQPTQERSATDWVFWYVEDCQFIASGGSENLVEILTYFLDTFLPANIDLEYLLDVHLPVRGYENQLWLKAEARMLSESTVELVTITDPKNLASYEWATDKELELLNQLAPQVESLKVDFIVGDYTDPVVYQAEDNMLRTFLVALPKS